MIWLDVTKSAAARHRSGLTRVTARLAEELGPWATKVSGIPGGGRCPPRAEPAVGADADGGPARRAGGDALHSDWYLTAEVFAPAERPGFAEFMARRPCRLAAIYHDSIPLRFPHITWPRAVARHPAYLAMLAKFDRIWAVSEASREELLGFWKWQGRGDLPPVDVLPLGADFERPHSEGGAGSPNPLDERSGPNAAPARNAWNVPPHRQPTGPAIAANLGSAPAAEVPVLVCVGILEPRKNQAFLLEVADRLWTEGIAFELHLVGRVNPRFGKPILAAVRAAQRRHPALFYEGPVDDRKLNELYRRAAGCVFPTIAEGCGLPLLEALWHGTPCISSDLPSLLENAQGGGCLVLPASDADAWTKALRKFLTEPAYRELLVESVRQRKSSLPTWAEAAGRGGSALSERTPSDRRLRGKNR